MNASKILSGELSRHPLFGGLNDDQLSRLLETAQVIRLDQLQHLFQCLQKARQFFMLRSGTIRLYLSAPDGSDQGQPFLTWINDR